MNVTTLRRFLPESLTRHAPRRRPARARLGLTALDDRVTPAAGLLATYFDNPDFTGPAVRRTDATVDFGWGTAAPAAGIGADTFSARWEGAVTAVEAGDYLFRTVSDEGVRLWVDGRLVVDNWPGHITEATDTGAAVSLAAGQKVSIRMDYFDGTGAATARLQWQRPGQAGFATVPAAQLDSPTPAEIDSAPEFNGLLAGWINAQDFGAVGDGVADDTAALQAALNALDPSGPRVLYLPVGTYRVTSTLTLRGEANFYEQSAVAIQGEDKLLTVLKWDGAVDGTVLDINGIGASRFSRFSIDGQNRTFALIDQSWDGVIGVADGDNEYSDLVLKNTKVGISGGARGAYAAELTFRRIRFENCSWIGIIPRNYNALDFWVADSEFVNCHIGAGNFVYNLDGSERLFGAGNIHVRSSTFRNSGFSDIAVGPVAMFSFRDNYSFNSLRFLYKGGDNSSAQLVVQNNRVYDTVLPDAVRMINGGPLTLIDNQFRSRPGNIDAVVGMPNGGDLIAVGNTFTVPYPFNVNPVTRTYLMNNQAPDPVPAGTGSDGDYELGMEFRSTQAGTISKVRYYKPAGETGTHIGRIWDTAGNLLASATFTNETASGWQEATLSTPLAVLANTTYLVSVNANSVYTFTAGALALPVTSGPLSTVADGNNGVFNETPAAFPTQAFNNTNYFRDVVFVPDSAPQTSYRFFGEGATVTIDTAPPPVPLSPLAYTRPVIEVTAFTRAAIQLAIDTAATTYLGQRPIVHLPAGTYALDNEIVVPAGADVQIVGDGAGTILSRAKRDENAVAVRLIGPSKATMRELTVTGGETAVVVTNADQPGGRLYGLGVRSYSHVDNIVVERTANLNVELHDTSYGYAGHVGAVVAGPLTGTGTGRFAVFGGLSNGGFGHSVLDDANFVLNDHWFEWSNVATYRSFLTASSPSGLPGRITVSSARVNALRDPVLTLGSDRYPMVTLDNFPGWATFLGNEIAFEPNQRYEQRGDGDGSNVFVVGSAISNTNGLLNLSANGRFVATRNQYLEVQAGGAISSPLVDLGTADSAFVTSALAQTRAEQPSSWLLPTTGANVTDLRLYRVRITGSGGTGLRILPGEVPAAPPSVSPLVNTGFEAGTSAGWGRNGNVAVAAGSDARTGLHLGWLSGSGRPELYQDLTLRPNTAYTLTGYLKADNPTDAAQLFAQLPGGGRYYSAAGTAEGYTLVSVTFQTDATGSVRIGVAKPGGRFSAYVDDLVLAEAPATVFTTQVPAATGTDGDYELGVRFRADQDGLVTRVRYYKPAGETGTHVGRVWDANGTLLASVTFANETASGWQEATLPTPVVVRANAVYTVSVNANTAYAVTAGGLGSVVTNGSLSTAAGANGVQNGTPGGFPTASADSANYFRDVVFVPRVVPPGSLFATPTAPAYITTGDGDYELGTKFQTATAGYVTTVRYYKPAGETGTHTGRVWDYSTGTLLATVAFTNETASGWQEATLATPLYLGAGTTFVVSVNANTAYGATPQGLATAVSNGLVATVADGFNGLSNATPGLFPASPFANTNYFRDLTFVPAEAQPGVATVFTGQTPAGVGTDGPYEMGMEFRSAVPGLITKVRFFKVAGETGTHTGRIWDAAGNLLASVVFTNETSGGWQEATLATPLPILADTTYVVSVNSNTAYGFAPGALASSVTNGPLATVADGSNGVFSTTPGVFPAQSFNNTNYFRDVVFVDPAAQRVTRSLYTTQVPSDLDHAGEQMFEVGTRFRMGAAGRVEAVRFYKAPGETGPHTGKLWDTFGNLLASVTFTSETAGGWQEAVFDTPVALLADTDYVVSVNANVNYADGEMADFGRPWNGALTLLRGQHGEVGEYPVHLNYVTYFVDVRVSYPPPTAAAVTLFTAQTPQRPDMTDGVDWELGTRFRVGAGGQVTAIRFYKAPSEGGAHTGKLWDAAGNLLATVTFAGGTASGWQTAVLDTAVTLLAGFDYVVSVNVNTHYAASDEAALGTLFNGPLTFLKGVYEAQPGEFPVYEYPEGYFVDVAYTVFTPPASAPGSLFTAQTPDQPDLTDGVSWELGTRFTAATAGAVTAVRFYKAASETGTHTGKLWGPDGTLLATVTFVGESGSGWQTAFFSVPVTLLAGLEYTVSVNANTHYVASAEADLGPVRTGPLAFAGGSYSSTVGSFPEDRYGLSYFVDVLFDPFEL